MPVRMPPSSNQIVPTGSRLAKPANPATPNNSASANKTPNLPTTAPYAPGVGARRSALYSMAKAARQGATGMATDVAKGAMKGAAKEVALSAVTGALGGAIKGALKGAVLGPQAAMAGAMRGAVKGAVKGVAEGVMKGAVLDGAMQGMKGVVSNSADMLKMFDTAGGPSAFTGIDRAAQWGASMVSQAAEAFINKCDEHGGPSRLLGFA